MWSTTSSALVASQAGPPDGSPLSTEAILMPSKARQLADDIRGAVASLPSHLDPLCQAISAKGGPKPPPGLLHSSVSLKPQLAHDPCLCATAALIQGTHLPAQMAGLICSLSFVFAHYISSPSCTQGCSVPRRFLFLIDSCSWSGMSCCTPLQQVTAPQTHLQPASCCLYITQCQQLLQHYCYSTTVRLLTRHRVQC